MKPVEFVSAAVAIGVVEKCCEYHVPKQISDSIILEKNHMSFYNQLYETILTSLTTDSNVQMITQSIMNYVIIYIDTLTSDQEISIENYVETLLNSFCQLTITPLSSTQLSLCYTISTDIVDNIRTLFINSARDEYEVICNKLVSIQAQLINELGNTSLISKSDLEYLIDFAVNELTKKINSLKTKETPVKNTISNIIEAYTDRMDLLSEIESNDVAFNDIIIASKIAMYLYTYFDFYNFRKLFLSDKYVQLKLSLLGWNSSRCTSKIDKIKDTVHTICKKELKSYEDMDFYIRGVIMFVKSLEPLMHTECGAIVDSSDEKDFDEPDQEIDDYYDFPDIFKFKVIVCSNEKSLSVKIKSKDTKERLLFQKIFQDGELKRSDYKKAVTDTISEYLDKYHDNL